MLALLTVALSTAIAAAPPAYNLEGFTVDKSFVPKPGVVAVLADEAPGTGPSVFRPAISSEFYTHVLEYRDRFQAIYHGLAEVRPVDVSELLDQMVKDKRILMIDPGTPVKILAIGDPDALAAGTLIPLVGARVRILEGPHKGRELETFRHFVVRLRPAPSIFVMRPKPPSPKDAASAATLFKSAQNLDRAGKTAGAVEHYRRVVASYPSSPEAAPSAARLKVLVK